MAKTVQFYGASDDLIEMDGDLLREEWGHYKPGPWQATLVAGISSGDIVGLLVSVWYDNSGTWQVGLGQIEEEMRFPDWPIRYEQSDDSDYSVLVTIEVPDDTQLTVLTKDDDDE